MFFFLGEWRVFISVSCTEKSVFYFVLFFRNQQKIRVGYIPMGMTIIFVIFEEQLWKLERDEYISISMT